MYQIGEFSKITSLTVKALRYYDEQKILEPSSRTDSGYRLYTQSDYEKARRILLLRKLNFSITEMKEVLTNCEDDVDLAYFLKEKRAFIEENIRKEKALMKEIDRHITPNNQLEGNSMNYAFEVKELLPVRVISVRYQGNYSDVGKYIGNLYKVAKSQVNGSPFHLYYDAEYKEVADIELCLPVKGHVTSTEFTAKELPGVKAICTTHTGSYEMLSLAYKAIIDFAKEQGYTIELPSREIYHKGPGMVFKGNPEKYETEIQIPIK
ncbi:MAG TPA: GyrI-like domain-containing protein [Lachnospiraceae bacterium]|nr:GyrI-like domain-containing protein [Lachnospiraceae bacterium]